MKKITLVLTIVLSLGVVSASEAFMSSVQSLISTRAARMATMSRSIIARQNMIRRTQMTTQIIRNRRIISQSPRYSFQTRRILPPSGLGPILEPRPSKIGTRIPIRSPIGIIYYRKVGTGSKLIHFRKKVPLTQPKIIKTLDHRTNKGLNRTPAQRLADAARNQTGVKSDSYNSPKSHDHRMNQGPNRTPRQKIGDKSRKGPRIVKPQQLDEAA